MDMQEDDLSKKNQFIYKSLIELRNKKKFNEKNQEIIDQIQNVNKQKFIELNLETLSISIVSLELSVRTTNCLINENIKDIGDLIQLEEDYLLKTPKFGKGSLEEIKNILNRYNLKLGSLIDWPLEKHNQKIKISHLENLNNKNKKIKENFIINNFKKLSLNINDIGFNVRTLNCLNNLGIKDIGELIQLSPSYLLKTPNFGRKSLFELKTFLKNNNLNFGTIIKWPLENNEKLKRDLKQNSFIINPKSNQLEEINLDNKIFNEVFLLDLIKSSLKEREYSIIMRRFWKGDTLEKIGENEKVTRERIRQVESLAIRKIKKHKLIFDKFLDFHKNKIFDTCCCTPTLVTKKTLNTIKTKYPLNDLDGLIYFAIEIIYEGNYSAAHIQKKYSFFENKFHSLGDGWIKENNVENYNNNTEDLIYFLDKKPLPRQCVSLQQLLKLTKKNFIDAFRLAQNRSNYYNIDNYICKNSRNWSTLSNSYLVRFHSILFKASPNKLIKNDNILELIRKDKFLDNCPYTKTIIRAKDLMRAKNFIKTNHLFYITGEGVIPLGVEENDDFFDKQLKVITNSSEEKINDEENQAVFGKVDEYLEIIEKIFHDHKALSITELSEIYVTKINQNIKPKQAVRILGILLAGYSNFIQIGPGVWSLKSISNQTNNLINFILKYKNNYAVDIYSFLKVANEDLSQFKGFNKNFEEKICINGKDVLSKNTYQSFLNISEPNKWDADNKIKNTFLELKKISNFFLDIKQASSFNIDSEKKIKTYDINRLGYSILYIFSKKNVSMIGLNQYFDYSLFWNTSSFNLVLLSLADLIEAPQNNLQAYKVNNTNFSNLRELVLDELIEFGYLSWNRKFGKKIISLILFNYNNFIQKDNWITENLALHGKI